MDYKQAYEQLQVEHHQLTEKFNRLFVEHKRLSLMLTPEQRQQDTPQVNDYIAWYMENYGQRPSSRLIEKFKLLNLGGLKNENGEH